MNLKNCSLGTLVKAEIITRKKAAIEDKIKVLTKDKEELDKKLEALLNGDSNGEITRRTKRRYNKRKRGGKTILTKILDVLAQGPSSGMRTSEISLKINKPASTVAATLCMACKKKSPGFKKIAKGVWIKTNS